MRIPQDAVIADEKLTRYLLVKRPFDDKSGFLAQAGFTAYNWLALRSAIRTLADSAEAKEGESNEYGTFYEVQGVLKGPKMALSIKLVWLRHAADNHFSFITLVPLKE